MDVLIEKVVLLVKTGNTDEDIGDFAGAANQEVGKGKAEEHWLLAAPLQNRSFRGKKVWRQE